MAQPSTNPKLEELRFKLKTDPKSRLFYQLAEELRKASQFDEAEQVLRSGLSVHPTYLAAWMSLGRVLREKRDEAGAIEALTKAQQLDPGNVVAARLLGDAHLASGNKVEAIKKYKLVHALHPADEELSGLIEQLDRDLNPVAVSAADPEPEPVQRIEPPARVPAPQPVVAAPVAPVSPPPAIERPVFDNAAPPPMEDSPFDRTTPPFADAGTALGQEFEVEEATGDREPMSVAHDESPFEEPVGGFTSASLEIEAPMGMQIAAAPLAAEVPSFTEDDLPTADASASFTSASDRGAIDADDVASTLTMADLYVRQGLVEDARHIYEKILARDPENSEVRSKLSALAPRINPKVAHLERWLARVTRREVGRV